MLSETKSAWGGLSETKSVWGGKRQIVVVSVWIILLVLALGLALISSGCSNGVGPTDDENNGDTLTPPNHYLAQVEITGYLVEGDEVDTLFVPKLDSTGTGYYVITAQAYNEQGDSMDYHSLSFTWQTDENGSVSFTKPTGPMGGLNAVVVVDESRGDRAEVVTLRDWYDANEEYEPTTMVSVTVTQDTISVVSDPIAVVGVINLEGEWMREDDSLFEEVTMELETRNTGDYSWLADYFHYPKAGPFSPLGALFITAGDSLVFPTNSVSTWASGHILENGTRVEYTKYRISENDTLIYQATYTKND